MFLPRDLAQLEARGVSPQEAERQLALLREPPAAPHIERPCTRGDGIETIAPHHADALEVFAAAAAAAGRVTAFVPASGAASRMFKELLACRARTGALPADEVEAAARAGDADCAALQRFVTSLDRFAFEPALRAAVERAGADVAALRGHGPYRPLLDALLDPAGLGYAERPKGLLPFHAYAEGARTAFEEHLVESAQIAGASDHTARLHLTVSPEHLAGFRAQLEASRAALTARLGVRPIVEFSMQKPSTDTLAVDADGAPFRDAAGALLLRPAGHGALIENLGELGTGLAFIKNVDNVASDAFKAPSIHWARVLIGRLAELQAQQHALLARLEANEAGAVGEAAAFVREAFGAGPGAPLDTPAHLMDQLDRPLRVCGMVPNTGEPGGGPFWVRDAAGSVSRQIIESAEVNARDPEQQRRFAAGTHFNPVFLACAVSNVTGRPHDLTRFVDPQAVIVTRKSAGGRELVALERPGLWNGAMARWNTVFVEVPLAVFNPVKTVFDLLRPEHQPGG